MEQLTDKKNSELSLTTIPDGSIVQVDGKPQGFSPILLEHVSPGEHEYEVSLPSYEVQKNTINVVQGFRMNITLKLAKQEYVPVATSSAETNSLIASSSATATSSGKVIAASTIATASSKPIIGPKIKIKPTGFHQNGQEVLHVRVDADPTSSEVGVALVGSEYPYLKQLVKGWYKINFNGKDGWVSQQFSELLP